jgi:hypothetical protein
MNGMRDAVECVKATNDPRVPYLLDVIYKELEAHQVLLDELVSRLQWILREDCASPDSDSNKPSKEQTELAIKLKNILLRENGYNIQVGNITRKLDI